MNAKMLNPKTARKNRSHLISEGLSLADFSCFAEPLAN
jgi:hypothetical protein